MPPGIFSKKDKYGQSRWRQIQHLANIFWKRWLAEYLSTLQKRHKLSSIRRHLKEDDLVLIVEENSPRGQWPLGRVVEVYQAKDGYVRSAKIKTRTGYLTRPITKLYFLSCPHES